MFFLLFFLVCVWGAFFCTSRFFLLHFKSSTRRLSQFDSGLHHSATQPPSQSTPPPHLSLNLSQVKSPGCPDSSTVFSILSIILPLLIALIIVLYHFSSVFFLLSFLLRLLLRISPWDKYILYLLITVCVHWSLYLSSLALIYIFLFIYTSPSVHSHLLSSDFVTRWH